MAKYLLQGCLAAIVLALTITSAAAGGDDCVSPCWRTIAIGVYKNAAAMRDALNGAGGGSLSARPPTRSWGARCSNMRSHRRACGSIG
jgi:hypothetical protein